MTALTQNERSQLTQQRPCALWFTGLSGAGKSALSAMVENQLRELGCQTYRLDGDNLRQGLCKDLGFSAADRNENIRRVGEVTKLMVDAGLMTITATISPFTQMRADIRALFTPGEFIEIFVDAPLSVCEARDIKGLYRKARAGEIAHFTGIDSAYEPPQSPEIHLRTDQQSVQNCAKVVIDYLRTRSYLPGGNASAI
jgi:adenylylsulfate kinase